MSGKKARTIDLVKSALVAFFGSKSVSPNPAEDTNARRYIVGLQKSNKTNNVDEEKKAHALTLHPEERPIRPTSLLRIPAASCARGGLLGLFPNQRSAELCSNDVQIVFDGNDRYQSVLLRWHKKANMEEDCQI
ncbi:hypothetical protein H257_12327 [Aphanomyces astaci]|uniref:Uncharacterized protein n=1 Tax=Aphanomyces astaci TaxID=112090 RepID=W4FZY8_APHAT|nr:hypothetical protein H257_12327 [Aphanomyces astaci]ETV72561.1 hypothetical protein H257_12327 [Aphanomyces astaci]|eukprot:XP_009837789.1 hypothetical protein H257_12327 [Aphanomyces astaci]